MSAGLRYEWQNFRSECKSSPLLYAFVFAAYVGVTISYSSFYLFHLTAVAIAAYAFWRLQYTTAIVKGLRGNVHLAFVPLSLLYYTLRSMAATDPVQGFRFTILAGCGFMVLITVAVYANSWARIRSLLFFLGILCMAELTVGLMETLTAFRMPLSRHSFLLPLFGRPVVLTDEVLAANDLSYLFSMPTGFHFNPNDFATTVALAFPFFYVRKKDFLGSSVCLISVLLLVEAGARLVFMALCLIFLLDLVLRYRFFSFKKALIGVLLFFIASNGFFVFPTGNPKVEEMAFLNPRLEKMTDGGENSGFVRRMLFFRGVEMAKEKPIVGWGPGQSRVALEKEGGIGKDGLVDFHFYWLEIAVEMGLLYGLLFALWYGSIMWRLLRLSRNAISDQKNIAYPLLLSLAGLGLAGIAPSSLVYFFPMYVAIGLGISVIYNTDNAHSAIG